MAVESFGQVMDTMDFVKRAWSTFNLPSPFAPTLSVEELDKRISDLRAVEQWLALNQNMLRSTIQGLEIQRGTLSAVRSMTDSFGQALRPDDESMAEALAKFAASAGQQAVNPAASTPEEPASIQAEAARATPALPEAARPEAAQPRAARLKTARPDAADSPAASGQSAETVAAAANPLAWWNLLQSNFQQIAQAVAGAGAAGAASASSLARPARSAGRVKRSARATGKQETTRATKARKKSKASKAA